MKLYYAHCMSWYGTPEEAADIKYIESQGYEVVNPNTEEFQEQVEWAKNEGYPVMQVFADYIKDRADGLVYRPLIFNGFVTAGVAREVLEALIWHKPVWQVGNSGKDYFMTRKYDVPVTLTVDETREIIQKGIL